MLKTSQGLSIVCTPLFYWGVEPLTKVLKRGGGRTGSQFLEGVWWERGGKFFQRELQFCIKNKLKFEIFNSKKSL